MEKPRLDHTLSSLWQRVVALFWTLRLSQHPLETPDGYGSHRGRCIPLRKPVLVLPPQSRYAQGVSRMKSMAWNRSRFFPWKPA